MKPAHYLAFLLQYRSEVQQEYDSSKEFWDTILRNEIPAEIAKAEYCAKMGYTDIPAPKYAKRFYHWAQIMGIPYPGPAPLI